MDKYSFKTDGRVCSRVMHVTLENDVITSLEVEGGCPGNLEGICRLVPGMKAEEVVKRLSGVCCGDKSTSCPDQLAQGLKKILARRKESSGKP